MRLNSDSIHLSAAPPADPFSAEGSINRVAQLYELKPALVRDALTFERGGWRSWQREKLPVTDDLLPHHVEALTSGA